MTRHANLWCPACNLEEDQPCVDCDPDSDFARQVRASQADPWATLEEPTPGSTEPGALISKDQHYRYRLWRPVPGEGLRGAATFLMLNPSTAGELVDDATIRKCVGFAARWGKARVRVVNLFAWRATDPRELAGHSMHNAVGPENDTHLSHVLRGTPHGDRQTVVVAWGSTGGAAVAKMVRQRRPAIRMLLRQLGVQPMCLGVAKDGNPRHPLMLAYSTPLVPWEMP